MKGWVVAAVGIIVGVGAIANASDPESAADPDGRSAASIESSPAAEEPTEEPEPTEDPVVLLRVADQKDGDSWVASDGEEYRLGLINTPERGEPCGPEATAFTRAFLADGFTVDAYSTDSHGRAVAEVLDPDGRSLNVALARSGLGDDRYLEQFRHENRALGRRLDKALASAKSPSCRTVAKAAPLVKAPPRPKPKPKPAAKSCASGYEPCLPVVADLNCPDIGQPVRVTGADQYGLDRDHDGVGCD